MDYATKQRRTFYDESGRAYDNVWCEQTGKTE
jgi:hypothetical protein